MASSDTNGPISHTTTPFSETLVLHYIFLIESLHACSDNYHVIAGCSILDLILLSEWYNDYS